MVEGPKVILKAERFRSVVSKVLLGYELPSSSNRFSSLVYNRCEDVVSVGKELFLLFDRETIRIHFQMSGSEIIMKSGMSPPPLARSSRKLLNAVLKFEEFDVYIFDSHISVRTLESFNISQSLISRDISLESFDSVSSVDLLQKDTRSVQEAIMDQMIMPGVGNIIKCEGLFRARINPNDISCNIPRENLALLVSMLHKFAREWLLACRRRSKLEYQIYGRTQCCICKMNTKLIRNIQGDGRITYYCPTCQISHDSTVQLGFVTAVKSQEYAEGVIDLFVLPKCKCISSVVPSMLQRVRKPGVNHNRLFWSCGKKGRNKCCYFAWADSRFPRCLHNKVSTIRRVLKTEGGNNGRYFFCCAGQNDRCKYFQWVDRVPHETSQESIMQGRNVIEASKNAATDIGDRKRAYSDMLLQTTGSLTGEKDENVVNGANALGNTDSGSGTIMMKKMKPKFKPIATCIQIPL